MRPGRFCASCDEILMAEIGPNASGGTENPLGKTETGMRKVTSRPTAPNQSVMATPTCQRRRNLHGFRSNLESNVESRVRAWSFELRAFREVLRHEAESTESSCEPSRPRTRKIDSRRFGRSLPITEWPVPVCVTEGERKKHRPEGARRSVGKAGPSWRIKPGGGCRCSGAGR